MKFLYNFLDGDEMNLLLVLDKMMEYHISRLEPHLGAQDLNKPRSYSGNIAMCKPLTAKVIRYHKEGKREGDDIWVDDV